MSVTLKGEHQPGVLCHDTYHSHSDQGTFSTCFSAYEILRFMMLNMEDLVAHSGYLSSQMLKHTGHIIELQYW